MTVRAAAAAVCLAGALAPLSAGATTTRVWTLGGMNRFILDDANKWLYPQVITKYGHLFYVELYGLDPSKGATAPTSQRGRDAIGALMSTADFVPVQGTAGGGMILGLTDDIFLGLHLSDYENPLVKAFIEGPINDRNPGNPNEFPWLTARAPRPVSEANRKFDVFAAYNIKDTASFGLLFTFGSSKYNYSADANDPPLFEGNQQEEQVRARDDLGASELRFTLGAGVELGEEASIDLGLGFAFHNITYLPNSRTDLLNGGGGFEFQGNLRAMIGITEWWELVPAIQFRTLAFSGEDLANFMTGLAYTDNNQAGREDINRTTVKQSSTNFDIGLAGKFKPHDYVTLWVALGYELLRLNNQYEHLFQEAPTGQDPLVRDDPLEFARDTRNIDALPYMRIALEARVFSWLDLRGGVIKYLRVDTVTEEKIDDHNKAANRSNDYTQDYPFFDYFIGFAAHYEGFFLDMQLDPNYFKRGIYALSGSGSDMFINGSLGYRF